MNTPMETRGLSLRLPAPQANPFTPSILPMEMDELRRKFSAFSRNLDLAPIKYKLIKGKRWTLDRAWEVEPQYKAFLFLIGAKVRGEFVPTFDVDEMWHTHILDTRKYMMDCALHFGEYIHHYPYLGMKDEDDRSRTEDLFASTWTTISDALNVKVHGLDVTSCGGGCGSSCGGHGCGGHGCGGGHSSCGSHGHHGNHGNNDSDSDIISSCGSSDGDDAKRKRRDPAVPGNSSQTPEKKRGIFQRIFNLSSFPEDAAWYASVNPRFFNPNEFRPDASTLETLPRKVN